MRVYFRSMNDLSVRCRRVIEELVSRRVPLAYLESINGTFVSIVTASGVSVLTLSRTMAIQAGIEPDSEFFKSHSKRKPRAVESRRERCTTHQEVHMPSIEPVRWAHPDTASDALKPLLDRCGGRVENVIVQRWCNPHFPPRHRERYVMAEYVLRNGAGIFVDAVSGRLLYPSGWILARA